MEAPLKYKILRIINEVYNESVDSKLNETVFSKLDIQLGHLAEYFAITKTQAFILANIFSLHYKGNKVDLHQLSKSLGCDPLKLLEYNDEINTLLKRGILLISKSKRNERFRDPDCYVVNTEICDAIINNLPIQQLKNDEVENMLGRNEANSKFKILRIINEVYKESYECELSETVFLKLNSQLSYLSEYFKLTKIQSFLLANIVSLNFKDETVDFKNLSRYFECTSLKILEFSNDVKALCNNGILTMSKSRRSRAYLDEESYVVHRVVLDAIINNAPIPETLNKKEINIFDVFESIFNLGELVDNNYLTTHELIKSTKQILEDNSRFPLINKIININLDPNDNCVLLFLIWRTLNGRESCNVEDIIKRVFDYSSEKITYIQNIIAKKNELIKNEWIEVEKCNYSNDLEMRLSAKTEALLEDAGINIGFNKEKKNEDFILPKDIKLKPLFYNNEEQKQLSLIKETLFDEKLKDIQKRLDEKSLPIGVTILLHGAPGTGKTESVLQIAKQTGRKLYQVDISQTRSMWFGESEKIIKRVFTNYKKHCKSDKLLPILFLNEADAIISKRKDVFSSNVAQTENMIQNVLLQELEIFEGILIATTNLVKNFDSAFERRFLFKVEFQKPNIEVRMQIWKAKIHHLSSNEYEWLANNFYFSGGQIDNISRKCEIFEISNGSMANMDEIKQFCKEEQFSKNNKSQIGYFKSTT